MGSTIYSHKDNLHRFIPSPTSHHLHRQLVHPFFTISTEIFKLLRTSPSCIKPLDILVGFNQSPSKVIPTHDGLVIQVSVLYPLPRSGFCFLIDWTDTSFISIIVGRSLPLRTLFPCFHHVVSQVPYY